MVVLTLLLLVVLSMLVGGGGSLLAILVWGLIEGGDGGRDMEEYSIVEFSMVVFFYGNFLSAIRVGPEA